MNEYDNIRCPDCEHFRKCYGRVSKGSAVCKERIGIIPKARERHKTKSISFWAKLSGWNRKPF